MERLTFDGLFCDIAMCTADPESCGGATIRKMEELYKRALKGGDN